MTNPKQSVQVIFLRHKVQLTKERMESQGGKSVNEAIVDGGGGGNIEQRIEEMIQ